MVPARVLRLRGSPAARPFGEGEARLLRFGGIRKRVRLLERGVRVKSRVLGQRSNSKGKVEARPNDQLDHLIELIRLCHLKFFCALTSLDTRQRYSGAKWTHGSSVTGMAGQDSETSGLLEMRIQSEFTDDGP